MDASEPPIKKAIVSGLGKGDVGYFPGDLCEATLIKPLSCAGPGRTSDNWFVQFRGDRTEAGHQITRIRTVHQYL